MEATSPPAKPSAETLAPNVLLAYHLSGWGTKHDIVYEDSPDATVRAYATRSARFYRSLGARFDLSFEDFSDRDAGFYAKQNGNPNTWFKPADFHRHLLYGATFVKLTVSHWPRCFCMTYVPRFPAGPASLCEDT